MHDPLTVECPDCGVPAGTACTTHLPPTLDDGGQQVTASHAERQRLADLRSLEHGTCAKCGARMVRGSVEGGPIDAWHPIPYDADRCPPLPDPRTDYNAWATAQNLGLVAGHPGIEHFVPDPPHQEPTAPAPRAICPECQQGKHLNCVQAALDPVTDEIGPCGCETVGHA